MSSEDLEETTVILGEFEILEFRRGKYVLLRDGVVFDRVTESECELLLSAKSIGSTDTGIIQVALATAAVSALLTSEYLSILVRILAFVAFMLSSFAAGRLYYSYLINKFPSIYLESIRSGRRMHVGPLLGLFPYYISLFKQVMVGKNINRNETEFGYLSLLASFYVLWLAIGCWSVFSIFCESWGLTGLCT